MEPNQTHKRLKNDRPISNENNVVGFSILRPLQSHKDSKVAEWPKEAEEAFLQLIVEEIAKIDSKNYAGYRTWRSFQNFLFEKFRVRYEVAVLKEKFNSSRRIYCGFSNMLDQNGFQYNPDTNLVIAKEDLLLRYIKENPMAKVFSEKGCEHYELLSKIFYKTTPSWKSIFSDDNIEVICSMATVAYQNFLIACENFLIELDSFGFIVAVKNFVIGRCRPMLAFAKNYGAKIFKSLFKSLTMTDDYGFEAEIKTLISSMIDTARHSLIEIEHAGNHGKEILSSASDPYSVDDCMDALDAIDGIEAINYFLAFQKFKNSTCRKKFLSLSSAQRKKAAESLYMTMAKDAKKRKR